MKRNSLFAVLLLFIQLLAAQEAKQSQEATITYSAEKPNPIFAHGIMYDSTNDHIYFGYSQVAYGKGLPKRLLKISNVDLTKGGETLIYRKFNLVGFDSKLAKADSAMFRYNLNVDTIVLRNPSNLADEYYKTYSFDELKNAYHYYFSVTNNNVISDPTTYGSLVDNGIYTYSSEYGGYQFKESTTKINRPKKPSKDLILMQELSDPSKKTITAIYGKENDEKWSGNKYMQALTYNENGVLLDSFSVAFPYPRMPKQSLIVKSKSNPSESVGKLFIFERMNMLFGGKKYNDPEKINYELIFCDNSGKKLLYKTFQVTKENNVLFHTYYALFDNNVLTLVAHNTDDLMVRTFALDGSETLKVNDKTVIANARKYDKEIDQRSNQLGDLPGLTLNSLGTLDAYGHVALPNGDFLIWGRNCVTVNDPNFKPDPNTPMATPTKVNEYRDFVCMQYNSLGELVSLYGSNLPNSYEKSPITCELVQGKLVFTVLIDKGPISEFEKNLFAYESLKASDVFWYSNFPKHFAPKFISINPSSKQMKIKEENAPFTLFNPFSFSTVLENKSTLYYYGYVPNSNKSNITIKINAFEY